MAHWPDFDEYEDDYLPNDRQFPPPYRETGWFKRASGGFETKYHSARWDPVVKGWVAFCAYVQGTGNILDHQGQDARALNDKVFMATTCRICHRFRDNRIDVVPPTCEYTNTYPYLGPTQIEEFVRKYARGPLVGSRPVIFTTEEVARMDVLPDEGIWVDPQREIVTFQSINSEPIGVALSGIKAGQLFSVDMTTGKITPVQESKMQTNRTRTAPRTIEQEARDLKNAARDLYIQAQILESLPAEPEENTVAFTIRYPDTTNEDGERVYEFLALRADNGSWYTTATGRRHPNTFDTWDALVRWWQDEGGDGPIFRATKWRELDA